MIYDFDISSIRYKANLKELNVRQRVIAIDIARAFAFPSEGFRNYGNTAIYEA